MDRPKLILCAGGTGAGKSRLLHALADEVVDISKCSIIHFELFIDRSKHNFTRHYHDEKNGSHRASFLEKRESLFEKALSQKESIILETHLENLDQLSAFVARARERGYRIELAGVVPSVETFMSLRKRKDSFSARTPLSMQTQIDFLDQYSHLPFSVDRVRIFERIFTETDSNVALLTDSAAPSPGGSHRLAQITRDWQAGGECIGAPERGASR